MTRPSHGEIEISGLSYTSETKVILSDITLTAGERRIGIVGRNGSGKTSLARMIAGLVPPTDGTVRVAGVEVAKDRKAALKAVGILFQNPDHQIIFPTVEEEIAFGLTQMRLPQEEVARKVSDTLARFDKEHWARAAIHQLSQGQRQLVCLMSVLAMAPKVIILDEPFAGLDIPTTRQLQRVLAGLDVTLVHITHDPAALEGYDRVVWLDDGRIVADGTPQTVLTEFTTRMNLIGNDDDLSDLAG